MSDQNEKENPNPSSSAVYDVVVDPYSSISTRSAVTIISGIIGVLSNLSSEDVDAMRAGFAGLVANDQFWDIVRMQSDAIRKATADVKRRVEENQLQSRLKI